MHIIGRDLIMQRWCVIQHELMPALKQECSALPPKLEKLVHILDWIRIEEWTMPTWQGIGRKPHDRSALASAFVAKVVLGLATNKSGVGLRVQALQSRTLSAAHELKYRNSLGRGRQAGLNLQKSPR